MAIDPDGAQAENANPGVLIEYRRISDAIFDAIVHL
jgi:hypothetical protein